VRPVGPRMQLVLRAEQDSWADIRDARQVKLLYETVPAGRTVTLEGVAPVSIFLGNAAGVRLDYNGQAVDVGRHKRGMMARFTLGEEAAAVVPTR
jgi:cytoskeleton protein RodZ